MYAYYKLTKFENPTFKLDDGFESIIVQINPDSIVFLESDAQTEQVDSTKEEFDLLFKGHFLYPEIKSLI